MNSSRVMWTGEYMVLGIFKTAGFTAAVKVVCDAMVDQFADFTDGLVVDSR